MAVLSAVVYLSICLSAICRIENEAILRDFLRFWIWQQDGSARAALASLPFNPREPQIIGKTQCFAAFLPFRAPPSSFLWLLLLWSSLFFSPLLWLFPPLLFHLSILSEVWLLNFLRLFATPIHMIHGIVLHLIIKNSGTWIAINNQ